MNVRVRELTETANTRMHTHTNARAPAQSRAQASAISARRMSPISKRWSAPEVRIKVPYVGRRRRSPTRAHCAARHTAPRKTAPRSTYLHTSCLCSRFPTAVSKERNLTLTAGKLCECSSGCGVPHALRVSSLHGLAPKHQSRSIPMLSDPSAFARSVRRSCPRPRWPFLKAVQCDNVSPCAIF